MNLINISMKKFRLQITKTITSEPFWVEVTANTETEAQTMY